jgi:hypothetical protein
VQSCFVIKVGNLDRYSFDLVAKLLSYEQFDVDNSHRENRKISATFAKEKNRADKI